MTHTTIFEPEAYYGKQAGAYSSVCCSADIAADWSGEEWQAVCLSCGDVLSKDEVEEA